LVPISNKKAPRKKVTMVKDEGEEGEKVGKKIHCNKREKKHEKRKKKNNKPKANLIFSHVNHTFFILDLQIGPQAFRHTLNIL